jgi:hypothetical protein
MDSARFAHRVDCINHGFAEIQAMPMMKRVWWPLLAAVAVSAFAADPVPDFLLRDVNAQSNRGAQPVSPRDYLFQVVGFYFATAST